MRYFEVKLVRSGAGRQKTQRDTLLGLGLNRCQQVVFLRDTAAIRGMLYKVCHLLMVTAHDGDLPMSSRAKMKQRRLLAVQAQTPVKENV